MVPCLPRVLQEDRVAADAQTRVHVGGLTQWGLHSIVGAKTRATGAVPSEGGGWRPAQARGSVGSVWASGGSDTHH